VGDLWDDAREAEIRRLNPRLRTTDETGAAEPKSSDDVG
jgi:hypothetical protein